MAAPVSAVNDILLTTIQGTLFAQRTITTFHWKVATIQPEVNLQNLLLGFNTLLLAEWQAMLSEDWLGDITTIRRLSPSPTRTFTESIAGTNGTVADDSLPPSTAGVISRFGNGASKSNRGRIYVPAVPEAWHLAGQLTAAGVAAYDAFRPVLDLTADLGGIATLEPVLFKKPNLTLLIEGSTTRRILRVQRRREVGVGV